MKWLKVSGTEVKGKEVCRLGVCPWESVEAPTAMGREIRGALMGGVGLWRRKEVLGRVSGSLQRRGGGRSSREAFPLPGEQASARLFLASCWSH